MVEAAKPAVLSERAIAAIREVVAVVASGDFARLEADGRIGRGTGDDFRRVLREYGATLVPIPADAFHHIEGFAVMNDPHETAVDVTLWTVEEGRSDLTLSLTVRDDGESISLSIDDLRVL